MIVIKRDGTKVPFDKQKIINAINKALMEVDGCLYETETAEEIGETIEAHVMGAHLIGEPLSVEDIQDRVEDLLMQSERRDVARAYIRYRYKKEVARNYKDDFITAIGEKLSASNVQNQNANLDEKSFGGRIGEASSYMTKDYALNYIVSDMARENHLGNMIYIHDLDAYAVGSHNCLTIPFDKLLAEGFNTRQCDVRPANSVNTAFQLVAVIFQLQSLCQFGGVSASHIDWTMVPYVRKSFAKHYRDGLSFVEEVSEVTIGEEMPCSASYSEMSIGDRDFWYREKAYKYALSMTAREIYQAVEAMYHNLNTLQSRSGNQLPFTSVNYGTCTLPEGRMVTKALLDVSIKGLGKLHKTSIFPCGIFQVMKGVNKEPGTPNYDLYRLALRSTAQRLYPNYANVDWSVNKGYNPDRPSEYTSTMGCRTYNGFDINGLGFEKDGRGNIAPVTIIMPTLAMMAKEKVMKECEPFEENLEGLAIDEFMFLLESKIYEAKDMLLERYHWICSQSPDSAKFMYENGVMAGYIPEEGIQSALRHGTLVIGSLGLAETLQILIGCDHTSPEGMELAKHIYNKFNELCALFKKELHLNFGVYLTPAENLCHTAMKKFREKYGVIENVSDKEFFTNSTHVPVWKEMSPFEKIDIESELSGYSNAGCITYIELDSGVKNNIDALETLVNYAMDKDLPYFAINVPNDTCLSCGYCDEFNDKCPECGSDNIQQLRRVTGYLTGNYTTAFNKGKQDEVHHRVKHI